MGYESVAVLNVEQIFESEYVIPLYQRNFAWGEEQIITLLDDIYESIKSGEQKYFIGTLVVICRKNGEYEVIDGQQRLTTLALLLYVLQSDVQIKLHYDSRSEVEMFLKSIASGRMTTNGDVFVQHFSDAIEIMKEYVREHQQSEKDFNDKLSIFTRNNVYLVREVMPSDTDVAAYFEIMNNRGEQLQEHEIVKGLLLEKLKDNPGLSQVCSTIWDACSQMNERIQKSFTKQMRISLFGEQYDDFIPNDETYVQIFSDIQLQCSNITCGEELSLILKDDSIDTLTPSFEANDEDVPEVNSEVSIIDFPNFLMHVMQLYYNNELTAANGKDGVRLHDKYLLKAFRAIEEDIDATEFVYRLLRCRTIFDRYIVKVSVANDNDEEEQEWSLLKPQCYKNPGNGRTQLKFVNIFDDKNQQDLVVKALSCIQVCHPSKYYKNYLQDILGWFKDDSIDKNANDYLKEIKGWILKDLIANERYFGLTEYCPDLQGTKISHSVLDYIDYLLWDIHKNHSLSIGEEETKWKQLNDLKDFRFQYWNSVEHHYPRNRTEEITDEGVTPFELNCLGNVFLVSKSSNSRMSDKNPKDKVVIYGNNANLAPNRQIIYNITRKEGWASEQIKNHLRFIEEVFYTSKKFYCEHYKNSLSDK